MGDVRLPDDDLARLKALAYTVLTARIGRVEIDAFIAATHPATILALIEELQAARARIAELEAEIVATRQALRNPPATGSDVSITAAAKRGP